MAAFSVTPLRTHVLTERHLRGLAERLQSRGVTLAPDAPTMAGDLQAGARAIVGLLAKLGHAAGPVEAAGLIAEIKIGEA